MHKTLSLLHHFSFSAARQRFNLGDEKIMEVDAAGNSVILYDATSEVNPTALRQVVTLVPLNSGKIPEFRREKVHIELSEFNRSVLCQLVEPSSYPELGWLHKSYERIRIYREWSFGRNTIFRLPQQADMRRHILEEDFSNLGLFLNRLKTEFPAAKRALLKALQSLYDGITDFEVNTNGGTVQVFLHEGDFAIPATRLSDGTLRYLCLLAILCDPEPPPLICIEEPELGLHPDILPGLADLLRTASERTQIIITTHSDILVDAMTETPECVLVCEKHEGKTEMTRLSSADLSVWLEKYRLGQLWIDGQLGGKRW